MKVEKEIDKLCSDTSTGIDQIPVKFVKLAEVHISGPLTHVINSATSSFPRLWKIARISPIPKADEPLSDADYRLISILPTLSKVFERLVLNQLIVYINEEALLGPTVSGFRKGHSTTTVLLGIRDALIRASLMTGIWCTSGLNSGFRVFSTSTSPTSRVSYSVTVINMLTMRRFTSLETM